MKHFLILVVVTGLECRVACIYKGYDFGFYTNNNCACIHYYDAKLVTQKYEPKRINLDKAPEVYQTYE